VNRINKAAGRACRYTKIKTRQAFSPATAAAAALFANLSICRRRMQNRLSSRVNPAVTRSSAKTHRMQTESCVC